MNLYFSIEINFRAQNSKINYSVSPLKNGMSDSGREGSARETFFDPQ